METLHVTPEAGFVSSYVCPHPRNTQHRERALMGATGDRVRAGQAHRVRHACHAGGGRCAEETRCP